MKSKYVTVERKQTIINETNLAFKQHGLFEIETARHSLE